MSFGNVYSLFNKFKGFSLPNEEIRRLSSKVIQKEVGVMISIEKIKIVNGILKIEANPPIKSEVFMKKASILIELEKVCKEKTPKDIR